jgi:hypothetical protein
VAFLTRDGTTAASTSSSVTNGSPDASHVNRLTIYWQHGAYAINVYRQIGGTGSETLLCTLQWGIDFTGTTLIWDDDGSKTSIGTAFPTVNTTGNIRADGYIRRGSYTVAGVGLPSASAAGAGADIFVSDEAGGAVIAFSDGTNWRRVTDRAVVS